MAQARTRRHSAGDERGADDAAQQHSLLAAELQQRSKRPIRGEAMKDIAAIAQMAQA